MIDARIKDIEECDASTVISDDMVFDGIIKASGPVLIRGRVAGKLTSDSGVFVNRGASVNADLNAKEFSVRGGFDGSVVADAVEFGSESVFKGSVKAKSMAMESGCVFSGVSEIARAEAITENLEDGADKA